jgi:hypothetical protein
MDPGEIHGFAPGSGLSDHNEGPVDIEEAAKAFPDNVMVLRN